MGLDLWFREDVARILASTWEAMRSAQLMNERTNTDYQRGVEDALRAVGLAFGLVQPTDATAQPYLYPRKAVLSPGTSPVAKIGTGE